MVEEHHQDEGEQSLKFQQFEQWSCVDESWNHAKMNIGVAKHSREFPEVKTSNETSHLQMPFYIHLSGDPLFSQFYFPHLPGLVEGCAVRWGCRDGLQGLPLNGFLHPPLRWVGASDCAQAGLAGCVLSNHGGRQLDTCRPGIEVGKWVRFDEVNCWGFTDAWCLDERSWQVFRRLRRFEWMWIVSNQALQLEVLPEVMEALKEAGATKVRRDCWGRKWLFFRFWIGLLLKLVFCLDFSCMFESKQGISFPKPVGWCPTLPTTACTRRPLLCSSMAVCVVVATSLKQWHWEHRRATQFQLARVAGRAIAWVGRLGRDFYTTVACCRVCMITIDNSW